MVFSNGLEKEDNTRGQSKHHLLYLNGKKNGGKTKQSTENTVKYKAKIE